MKLKDVETQEDMIEYYECLIDHLYELVPCMDELIALYDEREEDND